MGKLVIDGNKVYEIDEKCLERKRRKEKHERIQEKAQEKYRQKNSARHGKRFM